MLEEHYLGMVEDTDAINTYFEKMQQLAVEEMCIRDSKYPKR